MGGEANLHAGSIAALELLRGRRIAVLTGAGCSTDSGIPDYRGPLTRDRIRTPIQYQAFISDLTARQRYWARATVAWPRFRSSEPNPAHVALATLEAAGILRGVVTQNVDRLHAKAGSRSVVELHGALHEVRCLGCRELVAREHVHDRFRDANPHLSDDAVEVAPDGDAELPASVVANFRIVDCARCGGMLKPNVVFFGENVPRAVVDAAYACVRGADALLVIGSSLAVWSGYRFVRKAHQLGIPIVIANLGPTRGDAEATVRVEARAAEILPRWAEELAK